MAPPKAGASQRDLAAAMAQLRLLDSDESVRRGFRAAIREGRRCGLNVVTIGGVTLSSSWPPGASMQQPVKPKRKPKPAASRERDAAKWKEKRIKRKLVRPPMVHDHERLRHSLPHRW